MKGCAYLLALATLATFAAEPAAAKAPDIATCKPPEAPDSGERERSRPLPVPPALRPLLASSLYHYAVATLGGGTVCVDTSWIETAENIALSPDGRFLSFHWLGYETYGFKLVDRAGRGKVEEIGAAPVFSPSGALMAAVDQTESEFGSLSGLAVWRVSPAGIAQVAEVQDIPRMQGWRIDGWGGEGCIALSALPLTEEPRPMGDTRAEGRRRYVARAGRGGWKVTPAPRGGCAGR